MHTDFVALNAKLHSENDYIIGRIIARTLTCILYQIV